MSRFESTVSPQSEEFKKNRADHLNLIGEFRELEAKIAASSARALPKFRKRGQLLPRERIDLLLDRGSPFIQLSTLCGYKMHDDDGDKNISGGGSISGIGFISGVRCIIQASDSGIRGGAATPMGVDKGLRAQEIAMENKLPYVQLIESAGANLFRQADLFVRGGRSFANLAKLSAQGIPVIGVTHGSSTAGGAYQSGLCDYLVVVRGRSKIFLAGPPLLKAATGEIATDEELGGAEMHYFGPGTAEYMAEDDADGIRLGREIINKLNWNDNTSPLPVKTFQEPAYDPEEILGCVPLDYRHPYDAREVVARIVDDSDILDFKPAFGPHTLTLQAEIEGWPVGIITNNGPIDAQGAVKATQFIQLCCQSNTPIIFLQNTTGYMVGKEAEAAGIVKHGSKMIQAVSNATVPKLTLHIGASFGAGNYGMCGRSYDPRFIFAWPNNQISVMGGQQAGKTMSIVQEGAMRAKGLEPDMDALKAMEQKVIDQYDAEGKALFATARLWDDGLIDPRDSRKVLAFCLATCREGEARQLRPNTFGVARM
ncbi:MAG: acetyl-CoA carboxylase carboxyltransferase subunit [Candidatus Hydrogenedentota bacterium]|nr:MAG: acetyl-CoA carboxylase carboxyltransferase subunit [Candidatus Hydrogenedentota bacterium]